MIVYKTNSFINVQPTYGDYTCILVNKISGENTGIKQSVYGLEKGKSYQFKIVYTCIDSDDNVLNIQIDDTNYKYDVNNTSFDEITIHFTALVNNTSIVISNLTEVENNNTSYIFIDRVELFYDGSPEPEPEPEPRT